MSTDTRYAIMLVVAQTAGAVLLYKHGNIWVSGWASGITLCQALKYLRDWIYSA